MESNLGSIFCTLLVYSLEECLWSSKLCLVFSSWVHVKFTVARGNIQSPCEAALVFHLENLQLRRQTGLKSKLHGNEKLFPRWVIWSFWTLLVDDMNEIWKLNKLLHSAVGESNIFPENECALCRRLSALRETIKAEKWLNAELWIMEQPELPSRGLQSARRVYSSSFHNK